MPKFVVIAGSEFVKSEGILQFVRVGLEIVFLEVSTRFFTCPGLNESCVSAHPPNGKSKSGITQTERTRCLSKIARI